MKKLLLYFFALSLCHTLNAQEYVFQTFKDSRVVNTHSVETLAKRRLDIRIGHRFGDMLGDNGGWPTFYGLENATDVMIGAEYGFSNNFTAGIYRAKGAGAMPQGQAGLRQLVNGVFKWRLLRQAKGKGSPLTLTVLGVASVSTSKRIEGNPDVLRSFPNFSHRMAFTGQLLIARKFSDGFSFQLSPGYTHRNLVPFEDENGVFSLGAAARVQLSKVFGLIADVTVPFSERRTADNGFYPAVGIGLEIDTGGHLFQVNFTNATGIMETDYIPYTTSNWLDGEFRLGFTISRVFNL
ncbi:MAG: hypothetical protein KDD06_23685 [Phaeodactylibacter sp.]|nr:hypothetical protein [Phaeodactylibacter sp.]MCB9264569.1 hypothetical protein [Lewinellaceae bacterium]MCB9287328.1 hypothetical protein [Lewinellaceae bacterium]